MDLNVYFKQDSTFSGPMKGEKKNKNRLVTVAISLQVLKLMKGSLAMNDTDM